MENVIIRKATEEDIDAIHLLAIKIWNAHYPSIISQQQIDFMLDKMYSPQSLLQQMKSGNTFYVANSDGKTLGYLSFKKTGEKKYFLDKLYVDTTLHQKGIGKILFKEMEKEIESHSEIRLQVNRKNFKAINFYFKNGFVIEEVKDFDIGNEFFMKDFIMLKTWLRTTNLNETRN